MTTITNNTHSNRLSGSSALLALFIAVLATFVIGFAAPLTASAVYYDDCTGCGYTFDYSYDYDYGGYDYDYSYDYDYGYTYDYSYGYDYNYDYSYNYDYQYQDWYNYDYYDYNYYVPTYDYVYYTPPTYNPPTYNPPRYDPPRYDPPRRDDEPSCVLEASETRVDEGDRVTLYWTAQDADHATLTDFGSVDERSGSKSVTVNNDRSYTLRVTDNDGDSDTCSISIRVDEEEEEDDLWCDITASDRSIEEGDTVTLRWDAEGADEADINQGIGSVDEDGGTERVRPRSDTTYRLTVENNDGDEETCTVSVNVDEDNNLPPPPDEPIVFLSELPYTGSAMDAGTAMAYWLAIIAGAGLMGYYVFFRAMPFALAKAAAEGENEVITDAPAADATSIPENVTRQDVRAFVSAIASGDVASAREFANTMGSALFAEAAVVLDDVRRARAEGSIADAQVTSVTEGMSDEKLNTLVSVFSEATDVDAAIDTATA